MAGAVRRAAFGLVVAAVVLPVAPASAASDLTESVLAKARAGGVDASPLLARKVTIGSHTMTVRALLDSVPSAGQRATGPAGTPEVQAGDVLHFAINFGFDVPRVYTVSQSAVVPATPSAFVPVAPPSNPVIGPSVFAEWGGPLVQVKGSGYPVGLHVVGGPLTNASPAEGAPNGDPVWLSGRSESFLGDGRIDFTGHAGVLVNDRSCFFGFCIAFGVLVGDGAAVFDADQAVPGTPAIP
jgi:hypothetical protein